MYENTYEKEEKGKNSFILLLLTVAILFGGIAALFTNYKQETLICSKSQDICYLQKTNLVNMKSKKDLLKYSEIKYVYYVPRSVAGNMYAKGYTYYYPAFMTKGKESIRIFTTDYYEKDEVKAAVDDLKKIIKKSDDFFEYARD